MGREYSRLIRALQAQCILSKNEARSAIIAHRQNDGRWGGSEAVVHYGGATKCLQDAIRCRWPKELVEARVQYQMARSLERNVKRLYPDNFQAVAMAEGASDEAEAVLSSLKELV